MVRNSPVLLLYISGVEYRCLFSCFPLRLYLSLVTPSDILLSLFLHEYPLLV